VNDTPEHPVVVVGSLNLDLTAQVQRAPENGETVLGRSLSTYPGGKGANQAIGAARNAPTAIVGAVGSDEAGAVLRDAQRAAGVDVRYLAELDAPTGRAIVLVTDDGDNRIVVIGGANTLLDVEYVDRALDVLDPAVVLTQLESPPEVTRAVAGWEAARHRRFVLNASPVAPLDPSVLRVADPLIVNEPEAAFYVGATVGDGTVDDVAAALLGQVTSVVITRGSADVVVATRDGIRHVPVPSVAVVDTTGAGDHFAGTVAALLATGAGLADAAVCAAEDAARLVATARADRTGGPGKNP